MTSSCPSTFHLGDDINKLSKMNEILAKLHESTGASTSSPKPTEKPKAQPKKNKKAVDVTSNLLATIQGQSVTLGVRDNLLNVSTKENDDNNTNEDISNNKLDIIIDMLKEIMNQLKNHKSKSHSTSSASSSKEKATLIVPNAPDELAGFVPPKTCEYLFKTGTKKGKVCPGSSDDEFKLPDGSYLCKMHYNAYKKKSEAQIAKNAPPEIDLPGININKPSSSNDDNDSTTSEIMPSQYPSDCVKLDKEHFIIKDEPLVYKLVKNAGGISREAVGYVQDLKVEVKDMEIKGFSEKEAQGMHTLGILLDKSYYKKYKITSTPVPTLTNDSDNEDPSDEVEEGGDETEEVVYEKTTDQDQDQDQNQGDEL